MEGIRERDSSNNRWQLVKRIKWTPLSIRWDRHHQRRKDFHQSSRPRRDCSQVTTDCTWKLKEWRWSVFLKLAQESYSFEETADLSRRLRHFAFWTSTCMKVSSAVAMERRYLKKCWQERVSDQRSSATIGLQRSWSVSWEGTMVWRITCLKTTTTLSSMPTSVRHHTSTLLNHSNSRNHLQQIPRKPKTWKWPSQKNSINHRNKRNSNLSTR